MAIEMDTTTQVPAGDSETEGVIQFAYGLTPRPEDALPCADDLKGLLAWRKVLRQLELIGARADRYDGYGYGNLSIRHGDGFLISASQTSGSLDVTADDFVTISSWQFDRFWVEASGSQPPSSETLTHAMIYEGDASVSCVLHAHCPQIWQHLADLPCTSADTTYGSPAMAEEVRFLMRNQPERPLVFTTRGHEDGVFVCGPRLEEAAQTLINTYVQALEFDVAKEMQ